MECGGEAACNNHILCRVHLAPSEDAAFECVSASEPTPTDSRALVPVLAAEENLICLQLFLEFKDSSEAPPQTNQSVACSETSSAVHARVGASLESPSAFAWLRRDK